MKANLLLTALLLACAACAGERPQQVAATEPAGVDAETSATEVSGPPLTVDEAGKASAAATDPSVLAPVPEIATGPRIAPEATKAPDANKPEARRITPGELRGMIDRGEAVLVDVRGATDWAYRHATEAIHIPSQDLFARSVELPHEKLIALYCT